MNRHERRLIKQENREKEKLAVPRPMSLDQISGIVYEAERKAAKAGMSDGIRCAVEACMSAYTIVLGERFGFDDAKLNDLFQTCNDEIFRQLESKDIDLDDLPAYAERYKAKS